MTITVRVLKHIPESEILSALEDARGNLSAAAKSLGVLRAELSLFISRRPHLVTHVEEIRELEMEEAEEALLAAVEDEQQWAVTLVLKTAGKKRGYGKFPLPAEEPKPPEPEKFFDESKLTPEQLTRYKQLEIIACGYPDAICPPDPEFVQRLDQAGDAVKGALIHFDGNIRKAAAYLGVTRNELSIYLARRSALQAALGDPLEYLVDRAESALNSAVAKKQPWAIRFKLQTLGKKRGYSEDPRDDAKPVKPPAVGQLNLDRLSKPQLWEFAKLHDTATGTVREDFWYGVYS